MLQTTQTLRPIVASKGVEVEGLVVERPRPQPESGQPGLLWRLILVLIGFGMALTGWLLILTVFLSFLGLPLFIFGLALMQSQER